MKRSTTAILIVLALSISVKAQSKFKVGPSALFNISTWDEKIYPTYGLEVSYDMPFFTKFSFNVAAFTYYGEHKNVFDKDVVVKDLLFGVSPELRYHLHERFNGMYIGVGGDIKHLNSENFFPPSSNATTSSYAGTEVNLGASVGWYMPFIAGTQINPFLYVGGAPSTQQNEYEFNCRLGLNLSF